MLMGILLTAAWCYFGMDPRKLVEALEKLPALRRMEAEDFIRYLAARDEPDSLPQMRFAWAGGLSDLKSRYTSRDLKKQALDWMSGNGA
jgi:hypothetical protein